MEFITFVIGVVILFFLININGRVKQLEELIKHNPKPVAKTKSSAVSQPTIQFQTEPETSTYQSSSGPTPVNRFFAWLKEEWLMKLGALLLLIGFGWLATYAFLNNWIGPMGRIVLGIVAGTLILILGWWRAQKFLHQGGIFMVLGSTTILLTLFAAREIYDFFTPATALALMFLSTVFVALASVKFKSRSLSLASLILAGVAPLLTNSPVPNYVSLFLYLFVVILGALLVVFFTGQREVTLAALVLVALYSAPHLLNSASSDLGTLLLFAYAFAAVFFIANIMGIVRSKDSDISLQLLTAVGNGLLLLAWIMIAAPTEWQSLIISAWMIVFLIGAFLLFKINHKREPFYVYAGVGVAMLAAATSAELQGATLTIAYTIESALISIVQYFVMRDATSAQRLNVLFIVPVILSSQSIISTNWNVGIWHKDFFVLLILSLTLFGLGLFFRTINKPSPRLLVAGSIYAYILLWLSLGSLFPTGNLAVMVSLVMYTIIGIIVYFSGVTHNIKGRRMYGAALIGFVVARLFLVDVWNMELTGRIITFFAVGALLMSTAFLGRKKNSEKIN